MHDFDKQFQKQTDDLLQGLSTANKKEIWKLVLYLMLILVVVIFLGLALHALSDPGGTTDENPSGSDFHFTSAPPGCQTTAAIKKARAAILQVQIQCKDSVHADKCSAKCEKALFH